MKIAVTGALGKVGSAVVDHLLAEEHTVVSIDRAPADPASATDDCLHVDLTDYADAERALAGCDAVIHLAAINGPGRLPDHDVHNNNVVASYNVLRVAAEAGIDRVCQASSVNAIGGRFSRRPRYDYFPVDELHPAYVEDPYSLSKLICEQQGEAIARRYDITIASLRLHGVTEDRDHATRWPEMIGEDNVAKQLWGYTRRDAAARACLLGVTARFDGHEAFYVVAPETMVDAPSSELATAWYPDVPVRGELGGNSSFFDCGKAGRLLGWSHDADR
jgi:nucleoside-diphosphate-sugar epimerase